VADGAVLGMGHVRVGAERDDLAAESDRGMRAAACNSQVVEANLTACVDVASAVLVSAAMHAYAFPN
jgi:hypothetical protein